MYNKIQHGAVILSLLVPFATQANQCRSNYTEGDASIVVCDAEFIRPPVFGALCATATMSAMYTVQNNTPASMKINYLRIKNNDGMSNAATAIIASPTNSCVVGGSIAPGSFCNVTVQLGPLASGTFNRVLQVGIDTRQVEIDAPAITTVVDTGCTTPGPTPPPGFTPTIPGTPLALFQSSILAYSTVTNTGPTIVNGDLDLTPGSSVTGFPPGTIINGVQNINNTAATNTRTYASSYFTALNAQGCNYGPFGPTDLASLDVGSGAGILPAGVYCFSSSASISTNVNLNGAAGSSYTFRIGSTLITSTGSTVTLTNGTPVLNDNINWAIGSSATLGTNSTLYGIIDALASITLNTGATLNGRAWALNGAVTLDSNQVNPAAP